jgi:hypothetical protein
LKATAEQHAARKLDISQTFEFRERYDDSEVEEAWQSIRGQSSGISWHYLCILAGVEDIKADRMLRRFVATATGRPRVTADETYDTIRGAHKILVRDAPTLTSRSLDHAVWSSQRNR